MSKKEHNVNAVGRVNLSGPTHAVEITVVSRFFGLLKSKSYETVCGRSPLEHTVARVASPSPIVASLITCERCRRVLGFTPDKRTPKTRPMFDAAGKPTIPVDTAAGIVEVVGGAAAGGPPAPRKLTLMTTAGESVEIVPVTDVQMQVSTEMGDEGK